MGKERGWCWGCSGCYVCACLCVLVFGHVFQVCVCVGVCPCVCLWVCESAFACVSLCAGYVCMNVCVDMHACMCKGTCLYMCRVGPNRTYGNTSIRRIHGTVYKNFPLNPYPYDCTWVLADRICTAYIRQNRKYVGLAQIVHEISTVGSRSHHTFLKIN